ncbi:hypothetical protein BISU_3001 [Bifidobacterium subtile]|uniref:Uncharacterized protein n=1 Tax=Bifidobacterium subtile TaxID=77635 RepID=A0A087E7R0_9BIFI|nr:hypothetical protein BISU_3001 [Bifidobacterium subtile]
MRIRSYWPANALGSVIVVMLAESGAFLLYGVMERSDNAMKWWCAFSSLTRLFSHSQNLSHLRSSFGNRMVTVLVEHIRH